jgi:acetyl-CoA acetyltransferase
MTDVAVVAYCRTGIARATRGALNQILGQTKLARRRRRGRRAIVGVCTPGGMATAAYLERP